ncbi:uncharacterized protein [Chiloscyllium punctatum]|uniref:uncharacterized protein n=1 Tax=Chiloscyllium punctatum TaxID=137246 RepID=UPI003B639FA4
MKPLVDVTGRGRRAGAGAVSSCGSLKRSGFGGDFQEEGRASGFKEVIVVAVNCCFSLGLHFPRLSGSMFSWLGAHDRGKKDPEVFQTVTDGLKKLYKSKLLPLEEHYRFHEFHSPALDNADFDNKPMLLLVGQYSTGKTTFISSQEDAEAINKRIDLDAINQPLRKQTGNDITTNPRNPIQEKDINRKQETTASLHLDVATDDFTLPGWSGSEVLYLFNLRCGPYAALWIQSSKVWRDHVINTPPECVQKQLFLSLHLGEFLATWQMEQFHRTTLFICFSFLKSRVHLHLQIQRLNLEVYLMVGTLSGESEDCRCWRSESRLEWCWKNTAIQAASEKQENRCYRQKPFISQPSYLTPDIALGIF